MFARAGRELAGLPDEAREGKALRSAPWLPWSMDDARRHELAAPT